MHTETFHEGDRVRVRPSVHLMPKFHGADGVVVAWCHDNIYRVKLDAFTDESVFNANELKRLDTGDAAPASEGEWRWETIEEWNQVIIYMPWSDKVRPSETAMFGDYRGAWIARLEYNNGVPTRAQAEANAAQIVREHNSHRKLVEALRQFIAIYPQNAKRHPDVAIAISTAEALLADVQQ